MHLYLKEDEGCRRKLVLATGTEDERGGNPSRVLAFQSTPGNTTQVIAEFLPKAEIDLSTARRLTSRRVKGCLGLLNVGEDIFLVVILSSTSIGDTRPSSSSPESVMRIHDVGFFSLNHSTWDEIANGFDGGLEQSVVDSLDEAMVRDPYRQDINPAPIIEHPCTPLTKILSSGTFYYAAPPHWDISSRLALRTTKGKAPAITDLGAYDSRFVWNEYIVRCLLDLRDKLDPQEREDMDRCQFIVLAIQGYVGVGSFPLPAPPTNGMPVVATLTLISRLGWKRAGTRFNTRGIDDDGNCANFVETEVIFSTEDSCFSYVQARGSVPLFWEQQGLQTFGQKIQITRPHASQPAFERHFAQLMEEYGTVHATNLLGSKENEAILASAYDRSLRVARGAFGNDVGITHFDFHNVVRLGGHESVVNEFLRMHGIRENIDKFGYTIYDSSFGEIVTEQAGVFRTNCLDCLDRTNVIQDILSRTTLEQYLLLVRREWVNSISLWSKHRELWAENGDALSRIYAGTGALNTSFTRSGKRTLAGVLSDATKSVSRAYINNFQDRGKQVAIDMFLGNLSNQRAVTIYDPIHDTVQAALSKRMPEFSTSRRCSIFVGTWNLNGKPPSESLLPWLFPRPSNEEPDVFVIGFQEIVPLTAQQIIQTDPEKKRIWEERILHTLDKRPNKNNDYTLLRSEQLVGTALIILIKSSLVGVIRNVEATTKKTGFRGMSGNKGAVAIRFEYYDTSFCFLTAHLAAGHSNVDERNTDYRTISDGLQFLRGKVIGNHEVIVWLGDMNYRIDLDNETVRQLAESDQLDALVAADQLKNSIDSRSAFAGYEEGPLLFRPTYRYDVGTDRYDTSEKARIPAWTDRILYRGDNLDLRVYSRAELIGSDHKPVFALFQAEVNIIDHAKKETLQRRLFDSAVATGSDETLDEKLTELTLLTQYKELPPPSSDASAWWTDADHPEGVYSIDIQSTRIRSSNPFDSPLESSSASPSSSDDELYKDAITLQAPMIATPAPVIRKPPPPPLPQRSTKPRISNENAEVKSSGT